MTGLHFPHSEQIESVREIVSPCRAPLKWIRARSLRLTERSPEWVFDTGPEEAVLDILAGTCTVNIHAEGGSVNYPEIGGRLSVFTGKPTMVYIPRNAAASIFAESALLEGALFSAPARASHPPAVVHPDENGVRVVGKDNWQRTVITSIGENVAADRLIVGETINPPGNWSSAPPHKHDSCVGDERPMEEVYFYKLNPPQGFGLQHIYTSPGDSGPLDVTYAVRDGDLVAIPRGYHPVVAAPGYQLFYLWALAGDERCFGAWTDDPDHAWIKGAV